MLTRRRPQFYLVSPNRNEDFRNLNLWILFWFDKVGHREFFLSHDAPVTTVAFLGVSDLDALTDVWNRHRKLCKTLRSDPRDTLGLPSTKMFSVNVTHIEFQAYSEQAPDAGVRPSFTWLQPFG